MKLLPDKVASAIPDRLAHELERLSVRSDEVYELRLRVGQPSSLTVAGENLILEHRASASELAECVTKLCRGSVYAHSATLREGYISPGGGIRVGVCGEFSGGELVRPTSLAIRLAHLVRIDCRRLTDSPTSMLIWSPPGFGKTTILRELASTLGKSGHRVAVIDTRAEIYVEPLFGDTLCDFLVGINRAKGIELATRTLSPEFIICDELGGEDESQAVLRAQSGGVPLIASAHAGSLRELLTRPGIAVLHEKCVFERYVGLIRERREGRFSRCVGFDVVERDEIARGDIGIDALSRRIEVVR